MRPIFLHCSLAVLSSLGALAHASTLIDNANGYTLNAKNELVQFRAMAIDDKGRIIAVGDSADVAAKAPGARRVDLQGRTVIPGLIDAHGHVFGLGDMMIRLDLSSTTSLDNALAAVANYAKANPQSAWLQGRGWNQEVWKLGRFPTAAELDKVVSDRPAWFERVDGHAGWANTRAMELAGITDKTPDPVGGKIMRDANGKATGVLVDAAMDLVNAKVPQRTEAELRRTLDTSLDEIARMGLTSVHDAGMGVAEDKLYREYASAGKLTARVYAMIGGVGGDFDALSKQGPLNTFANDMYALRSVKLYSDGALGSRGAAMISPYSDDKHTHGLLFNSDAKMNALIAKAMRKGYQVNVHAIGDAGNRQVLNALADQLKKTNSGKLRHRIEHAQVVTPADIARFRTVGIIPSMQPTHATSDMNMAENRVGPERIKGAYAWRTYLHQGSKVACGSDFPVESPNPFYGIHAAVTRQDARGMPVGGWYPEQAMSLKEALRCFTLDAAHAAHQENMLGSLEPGKWADFIVIDRDLFRTPESELYATGVLQTWVAGRPVYEKK
ncbi:amidohydrolase [Pseudoduganella sp. GCM10020061]|uniref:amidohydrolase n=1 Tax=Pseudoduganella sp. GCM10020061 TaxID=3317345 RepID=UPI00363D5B49